MLGSLGLVMWGLYRDKAGTIGMLAPVLEMKWKLS